VDWARGEGFGFSQIVSLGNQADVNETDMLSMLADDPHTKVIVLYMESVSDGKRFVQVAREVTQHKPVIALKVGRFESGQKAAASHTGALAASDTAFDAAFEKAGILRADTTGQMFDWARALENCPLPSIALSGALRSNSQTKGGIAILTNAGGPGVIAADSLEHNDLSLAKLHEPTLKALIANLPPAASVFNPVDMLASASPEQYALCLKLMLKDPNVDGAMVILPPPPMFKAEDVAEKLIEVIHAQAAILREASPWDASEDAASSGGKPVVIALMGSTNVEQAAQTFRLAKIPTYPFPERAASALSSLYKHAEYKNGAQHLPTLDITRNAEVRGLRTPDELLKHYGIPTAPLKLARDENEAFDVANRLGYPIAMKIASPDILHKSDVGGVILNISDPASLKRAYTRMLEHVKSAKPNAHIDGVYIQQQILQGQEVIVGMMRDAQFGPLMMFGSGGVEVEGLKDVAFALAPLNQAEAGKMIRKTWAGRKLKGFRNIPPADEESVIDVLIKLSWLAIENENIEEIEINPLRVLSKGAVAVDIRIKNIVLP
jgi:acetyltransferase